MNSTVISDPRRRRAPSTPAGWRQSLADGAPGVALLHIARAHAGLAGWQPVHRLAWAMTAEPVQAHPGIANLFYGAPAVAYALHTADHPAYHRAQATLDDAIASMVRLRLQAANQRIDDHRLPQAREYDLINGLTGLGAYLMHRDHDRDLLHAVLAYVVRLTEPLPVGDATLPGWWAAGSPDRHQSPRWDGGHAGFGLAHGIAGPLALLSTAMRRGVIVAGHRDAIAVICAWLDRWQQRRDGQVWWPEVIDRTQLLTPTASIVGPHRPSWCYGTPGIARAQQLAAIALDDPARARTAERALLGCLTDQRQLAHLVDAGLCHGWAGLIHTARCAATDAETSDLAAAAAAATDRMHRWRQTHDGAPDDGLLDGATGVALVESARDPAPSGWDACLLVGAAAPQPHHERTR